MPTAKQYAREPFSTSLSNLRENVDTDLELINKIIEESKKIGDYIEQLIRHKWSKTLARRALLLALDQLKDIPKEILGNEVALAAASSKEFAFKPYTDGLLQAVNNDNTYSYVLTGSENVSDVTVKLLLNQTAGTLKEYAEAVTAARKQLLANREDKGKPFKGGQNFFATDPLLLSIFWKEKIYKPGREEGTVYRRRYSRKQRRYNRVNVTAKKRTLYGKTITLRRSHFEHPAPWWELLDKGNTSVNLDSDQGGDAYPVVRGTHFTDKARKKIKEVVNQQFILQRDILQSKVDKYITRLTNKNKKFIQVANEMSEALANEQVFASKVGAAEELIKGLVAGYEYDEMKVKALARDIAMGEEVVSRPILGRELRRSIRPVIERFRQLYE